MTAVKKSWLVGFCTWMGGHHGSVTWVYAFRNCIMYLRMWFQKLKIQWGKVNNFKITGITGGASRILAMPIPYCIVFAFLQYLVFILISGLTCVSFFHGRWASGRREKSETFALFCAPCTLFCGRKRKDGRRLGCTSWSHLTRWKSSTERLSSPFTLTRYLPLTWRLPLPR